MNRSTLAIAVATLWFAAHGLAQDGVMPKAQPPVESCWAAGASPLSPAETRARLRHTAPVNPPLLAAPGLQFTPEILVFRVRAAEDGHVACLRAVIGHPLLLGTTIESLMTWKFRPEPAGKSAQPTIGTLVVRLSQNKRGAIRVEVLDEEPEALTE